MADPINITDLTTKQIDGTGVFDELMAAVNVHLQAEYAAQRIRGTEYADVYLGALQTVLGQSIQFLLSKEKAEADTALVEAQTLLVAEQTTNATKEGALIDANASKVAVEETLVTAEVAKTGQETTNLISAELLIDAQTANQAQETLKAVEETALVTQNTANAVIQGTVLTAQECKLRAEFDLLTAQVLKVGSEKSLLDQKQVTESAQTSATGIDAGSVVGKQIALYTAQADGFARDAEQKAAKIMADTWNVRRTTDEGVSANSTNKLDDVSVGAVVAQLMTGINA